MKSFIFTSEADLEAARLTASHLRSMGVEAVVVRDRQDARAPAIAGEIMSSFERRGRLRGTACAVGIAGLMARHAGDVQVVAKVDADTWLSREAVGWLAQGGKGRGFRLSRVPWLGIWSTPTKTLGSVVNWLGARTPCPSCPEAALFHRALLATCGTERVAGRAFSWTPGCPWPPDPMLVTLPSGFQPRGRVEAVRAMHVTSGPVDRAEMA